MAGLNLQNEALTFPAGQEFPGTPQELLDSIAQYLAIVGDESFSGINYGSVEPDADNRDKPWFRLDDENNPLGWYSWDGTSWTPIPQILASGPTASRPVAAIAGQLYEDTDIGVTLKYTGGAWVTLAGSPGDVKYVKTTLLADALTANPGWSQDPDSVDMSIGGASSGSNTGDHAYASTAGAESATLVLANLPGDAISLLNGWGVFPGAFQNGSQSPGVFPITTGLGTANTQTTGPLNGGATQIPVPTLSPTIYYWCLVKDSE